MPNYGKLMKELSMKLVTPSLKYQRSYQQYIDELKDEERYPFPMDFDHHDFAAMLAKIADFTAGNNLPKHAVPSTTLWLVEEDELIGVTNLRHYLNDAIAHCGGHIGLGIRPSYRGQGLGNHLMHSSIAWLQAHGVNEVHIHCYQDNLASVNAIISNAGVLESEIAIDNKIVQRYLVKPS